MIRFSIVMPYYKNEHIVHRSVESVLAQTYSDYELIIVDDGSHDHLDDVIAKYNDPRITVIHQENQGVAVARNVAIKNCSGEWICFLDSDDEWFPMHLSHLYELQCKYKDELYFVTGHKKLGNTIKVSSDLLNEVDSCDFVSDNLLRLVFLYGEVIHTNSICLHRSLIEKYGCFVEGVSIGEDTDLWYRLSLFTSVVFSKTVTTLYHRDASYLTKHTKYAHNWPFCSRMELIRDNQISQEKSKYMLLIIQRYTLTQCKHLIAEGKKKECRLLYNQIKQSLQPEVMRQKKQLDVLLMLPSKLSMLICNRIYQMKQKQY